MRVLAVFVAVLVSACVSVEATRLGAGQIYPPVSPDKVYIYRTAQQVPGRYTEVALLSGKGDYSMTTEEQMYQAMREKAGAFGANAIILDSMSEPTTGAKVANAFLGTAANRQGKAIAIRTE